MYLLLVFLLSSTLWTSSSGLGGGGNDAYVAVCYDDIGCFTNAPPWGNTPLRPTSLLPQDPAEVDTRFYLDTKQQAGVEIYYNDMEALARSTFSPSAMTRLIIHGYMDNDNEGWMEEMSDRFLVAEDDNVIRVKWAGNKVHTDYDVNVVNSEVVGRTTGVLINNMITDFGMSGSQFHCVGHSIGAHACAYVGNVVYPLGRISGLDPAGPYFAYAEVEVRLDVTDATFVDVIHTDAEQEDKGIGTPQPCGHVDYWPNGGRLQPGCDQGAITSIVTGILGLITSDTREFVACNHYRAVYFFSESITTQCPFKSYPCPTYEDFVNGKCLTCASTHCPQLGYHASEYSSYLQGSDRNTDLETNPDSPYCEYMTNVKVTLGSNSVAIKGQIFVTLEGPNGSSGKKQLGVDGSEYELRPDVTYTDLVYYPNNPGYDEFEIDYVTLSWVQKELELGKTYISVTEVEVWAGMAQKRYVFCGKESVLMKEKTDYTLYPTCF